MNSHNKESEYDCLSVSVTVSIVKKKKNPQALMKSRGKTILIPRVCKSLLGWHTNSNSSFPSSESRVSSPYFCILEIIRKGAVHLASFQFYNHLIEEIKGHWLQQSSYGPEHHCECRDVCVCASCASSTTAHRCAPVNELHRVKKQRHSLAAIVGTVHVPTA